MASSSRNDTRLAQQAHEFPRLRRDVCEVVGRLDFKATAWLRRASRFIPPARCNMAEDHAGADRLVEAAGFDA